MTGDFLFGFACGVGAFVALVLAGAFLGRLLRSGRPDEVEPCSDL